MQGSEEIIWDFDKVMRIITAIISLSAFIATYFYFRLTRKHSKSVFQAQVINLRINYYNNIRTWAAEVIDLLSEIISLSELDPSKMDKNDSFFSRRHQNLSQLSSLIDRGRLFLPNSNPEIYETSKQEAFRGFRQKALDELVEAYEQTRSLNYEKVDCNHKAKELLVKNKRNFVSEVQTVIEVRRIEKEIKAIGKEAS